MKRPALLALALAAVCGCAAPPAAPVRVGGAVLLAAPPGGGGRFLGSEACRGCHPQAYARWSASAHARDHAGLPATERLNAACLRCHVTGYGDSMGYRGGARGLASVGCEACHGAGSDHAGSIHPGLVPTATGGECPPCEINRICRLCHTPGHSPAFDLAAALERIACGDGASRPR